MAQNRKQKGKAISYILKCPIFSVNRVFPCTLPFLPTIVSLHSHPFIFFFPRQITAPHPTPLPLPPPKPTNLKFTPLSFSPFALYFSSLLNPSQHSPSSRGAGLASQCYHSPSAFLHGQWSPTFSAPGFWTGFVEDKFSRTGLGGEVWGRGMAQAVMPAMEQQMKLH